MDRKKNFWIEKAEFSGFFFLSTNPPSVSEPVTSIQIRLADGTREVQKFNKTHTVGDLRKVMASKSGKSTFKIMQAYPPKCLEDDSLTLEEAGLLNAAVMQR